MTRHRRTLLSLSGAVVGTAEHGGLREVTLGLDAQPLVVPVADTDDTHLGDRVRLVVEAERFGLSPELPAPLPPARPRKKHKEEP